MTDLAVAGVNMVPGDSCDATKMRVTLIGLSIGASQVRRLGSCLIEWRDEWCRHGVAHRKKAATPIRIPTEIVIDMGFDLSRHGLIRIDVRAVLNLLHGQFDGEVAQRPIGLPQGRKRQKDFAAGKPIAGVDHKPSNDPADVFKKQIADGPEPAIAGLDGIAIDCRCIPQHSVLLPNHSRSARSSDIRGGTVSTLGLARGTETQETLPRTNFRLPVRTWH